jgi:pyruvate kinase
MGESAGWHRTKIVCTLGPATDAPGVLEALVRAGMSVARINLSHGQHAEHAPPMPCARCAWTSRSA